MIEPWVSAEELGDEVSEYSHEAVQIATHILWALSGRKYGQIRTVTETYECPCRRIVGASAQTMSAIMVEGKLYNLINKDCGCAGAHTRLRLRHRPVIRVLEVISNGSVMDPTGYSLANGSSVVSHPGVFWDPCDATITYTYGSPPPVAGRRAVRFLADQLVKSWTDDEDCRLPDRVTSVSRQGVSYTILDDQSFLDQFRTGIYEVDLFLKSVNPANASKPSKVFSPDLPRGRRVTRPVVVGAPAIGPNAITIVSGEEATWDIDLGDNNASIIDGVDWLPVGQISTWNGAILLEFSSDRFSITGDVLIVTLSATDTAQINLVGNGTWDLYAQSAGDVSTMIHVQSGSVYLSTSSGSS